MRMLNCIFWITYIFWYLVCGYLIISARRKCHESKCRYEAERRLAHCRCGVVLSAWFVHDGYMWHPRYFGCGWISPWPSHEDYRAALYLLEGDSDEEAEMR